MGDLKFLIEHYLREGWRRRWSIMITAWIAGVISAFFAASAPDVFESQAIVNVNTRSLLRHLVAKDAILDDPNAEVEIVRRLMYTRPTLEDIIHRSDLHLDIKDRREQENVIKRLTEKLAFERPGMNTYRIAYSDADPEKARRVVQAALDKFISLGLDQVGGGVRGADQAKRSLLDQLDVINGRMDEIQSKINDFERDQRDLLAPSSALITQSQQLTAELNQLLSEATFTEQEITRLQSELARTDRQTIVRMELVQGRSRAPTPRPDVYEVQIPTPTATLEEQRYETLVAQAGGLQQQLTQLLQQYTAQHPDVARLRGQIDQANAAAAAAKADADAARARQQADIDAARRHNDEARRALEEWRFQNSLPAAPSEQRPVYGPNPLYAQIESQIGQSRSRAVVTQQKIAVAREGLADIQQKLSAQPEVSLQYATLREEREKLAGERAQIEDKLKTIEVTTNAEQQELVRFEIKESPERPVNPVGPNRLMLFAGAGVGSLLLGFGLAFLRMQLADTMPTLAHVRNAFDLPILGSVSAIENSGKTARTAASNLLLLLAFALFVMLFALLIYKFHVQLWRPSVGGFLGRIGGLVGLS